MPKFTNINIKKLKCPKDKNYVYLWDAATAGFGVRCTTAGVKSFILRYRLAGRQRIKTLGRVDSLDISKATKKARTLLGEIYSGTDPFSRKGGVVKTVFELSRAFQAQRKHELKPKTLESYESLWVHINNVMGKVDKLYIDSDLIAKLKKKLQAKPTTFNRCVALLICALKWDGIGTDNHPLKQVKRHKEKRRERILSDKETHEFYTMLLEHKKNKKTGWRYANLAILLLLTGLRRDEWRLGRWEWLQIDNGLYVLPDNKTGGRKVHLAGPVLELIREIHKEQGHPKKGVIFPSARDKKKPISWTWRQWDVLRRAAGLDGFRVHDTRHTAGSKTHSAAGLSQRQVADFLGHAKLETSSRYIHDDNQKKAAEAAGEAIAKSFTNQNKECKNA